MADKVPQTFTNHSRYVPGYHGLLTVLVVFALGYAVFRLVKAPSLNSVAWLVVAIALIQLGWYARVFALTVQDRLIRLEETLRLQRLAPDVAARAAEVGRRQWVALRFASDAEFPALVTKVLDEKIGDEKAIKQLIKTWRPDYCRA